MKNLKRNNNYLTNYKTKIKRFEQKYKNIQEILKINIRLQINKKKIKIFLKK
jgi:hypothetical protein